MYQAMIVSTPTFFILSSANYIDEDCTLLATYPLGDEPAGYEVHNVHEEVHYDTEPSRNMQALLFNMYLVQKWTASRKSSDILSSNFVMEEERSWCDH
jgi:hypothetical protein